MQSVLAQTLLVAAMAPPVILGKSAACLEHQHVDAVMPVAPVVIALLANALAARVVPPRPR